MNNKRVGVHGGIPLYTDVIKGLVFDMDGLLFDSERVAVSYTHLAVFRVRLWENTGGDGTETAVSCNRIF